MGYQIQYGVTAVKTYVPERKKNKSKRKNIKIIFAFIAVFIAIYLGSRDAVLEFLLPGDGKTTRVALSRMVADIQDGEPFGDVVEAFCLEIVNGAKNSK